MRGEQTGDRALMRLWCLSLVLESAMCFIAPTAQMQPMQRPSAAKHMPLRRGPSAVMFGRAGMKNSNLASFMAQNENAETVVAPTIERDQSLEADAAKPIPAHTADKHAFCHAGVCNFHEDEFELGPEAEDEEATMPMAAKSDSPFDVITNLMADAENMSEATATWWILGVVAVSGVNFGVVKQVTDVFDNPTLLFGRFLVAAACLSPWLFSAPKKVWAGGLESGAWLAGGYIAQAVSLAGGTPSSICSFFASLSCIVCPFIEQFLGVRLDRKAWAAAALAIAGAGVLELGGGTLPTQQDLIALLQPLLFGIYLIRTEDTMKNHPKEAMAITALQLLATTLIAAAWGAAEAVSAGVVDATHVTEWVQNFVSHPIETAELAYMGAGPSAMALAIETVVLAKLSSSKTALLFSTEPLFAAVFGATFLSESVGANVVVGGLLATTACLVRSLTVQDVKAAFDGVLKKKEA